MSDAGQSRQITNLGKAMIQVNLRLSRVLEILEGGAQSGGAELVEPLLDLLEAAERTLEQPAPPAPAGGWFARWFAPAPAPAPPLDGLRIAVARTRDALQAQGLEPIPTDGAVLPALHRVTEALETDDPERHGKIARTHLRGWYRPGDPPEVLRQSQVSAWRHSGSEDE